MRENVVNSILCPKFSPKTDFCAKELIPRNVCQSERFEVTWRSVCICVSLFVCVYDFESDFKRTCFHGPSVGAIRG